MGTTTAETARPVPVVARIALLVFAMLLPTFMASMYFVVLAGSGKPNIWQQVAYGSGKVLQFAFPVLFVLLVDRRFPLPKKPHFAGLGMGLAFGLAVAGAMLTLYYCLPESVRLWLFEDTGPRVQGKLSEVNLLSPAKYIAMSVVIVAVHSLAEEYYWRWFTFAQLNRLVSLPLAMTLSSVAFVGHHILVLNEYFPGRLWIAVIPFSIGIAVGGAFWAWLFSRTQSIYSSWLSHALVDAAIFVIGWDLLRTRW